MLWFGRLVGVRRASLIWLTASVILVCIAISKSRCHCSFSSGSASVVRSSRRWRLLDFLLVGLWDAVLNLFLGLVLWLFTSGPVPQLRWRRMAVQACCVAAANAVAVRCALVWSIWVSCLRVHDVGHWLNMMLEQHVSGVTSN